MPRPDLLADLKRSGPEPLGSPLHAVAVLARDVGQALAVADDPLAVRRRRSSAARAARAALSFAAVAHGAFGDRPDARSGWTRALRALEEGDLVAPVAGGASEREPVESACLRALGRVAALVLLLPPTAGEDDWQAEAIAFADEGTLAELHAECLALAATAGQLGSAP